MTGEEIMFGILMRTTIENFWPLATSGKGKLEEWFLEMKAEEFSNEVEEIERGKNDSYF